MRTSTIIVAIIFAIALPRLLGLDTSGFLPSALWGAVFGGLGGLVMELFHKAREERGAD